MPGSVNNFVPLIHFDRLSISLINTDDATFTNAYIIGDDIPGRNPGEVASLAGTVTNEAVISRRAMVIQGDPAEMERRYPNLIMFPSVLLGTVDLSRRTIRRTQRQIA